MLEVGVEVIEQGGEAGEVGGKSGLSPAGEEDAGEGRDRKKNRSIPCKECIL